MRYFYMILIVLFIAFIAIFAFQNRETATLSFLGWKTSMPIAFGVIIVYILGMITGSSVSVFLKKTFKEAGKSKNSGEK
ncbi:LapA family protein [candidate division WOR-3 bacterium]|nr:LapA family protein [candidate division WOR-3 bacterium]